MPHNTPEKRLACEQARRQRKLEEAAVKGVGLCSGCLLRPPVPGRSRCKVCATNNVKSQRRPEAKDVREAWKKRKREEAEAQGIVLCSQCYSHEAKPGRKCCQGCVDTNHGIAAKPGAKARRNARAKAPEFLAKRRDYGSRRTSVRSVMRKAAHRANPLRMLLWKAKERAAQSGVEFRLTVNDLVMPEMCPLLGIPIRVGDGKAHSGSPSVDRVIPSLGYVPDNVWIISHRANAIKNDATLEELKLVVCGLEKRLGVEVMT